MSPVLRNGRSIVCAVAVLTCLGLGACLYDPGERCGPVMLYVAASFSCVCEPGAIAVSGGCQRCAADEVVSNGQCVCPTGQTKNASNVCAVVSGLGDACDTADAPCNSATYSFCAATGSGTAGTCTKTCTTNTDCDGAYTCTTWEAQPLCRAFVGVGAPCTMTTDCVGDANYCDAFQTHSCMIQGCSLTANDCPRGLTCCDFSRFHAGNLCAGACL